VLARWAKVKSEEKSQGSTNVRGRSTSVPGSSLPSAKEAVHSASTGGVPAISIDAVGICFTAIGPKTQYPGRIIESLAQRQSEGMDLPPEASHRTPRVVPKPLEPLEAARWVHR
jgi:hypothetical protein